MRSTFGCALRHVLLILVATGATAFLSSTANAQQSRTYALVPGIPGGSIDKGHEGWIDVFSISQGWASGKKTACQISFAKPLDIAGPRLWLAAVTGQTFTEIRFEVVKQGGDTSLTYYVIRLQNATVSSISTGGSSGGDFFESVSLSAANLILSYYPQNSDGSLGAPVTTNIPCS